MIRVKGQVTSRGMTFRIAQRELNNVVRDSMTEVAEYHHENHIPDRFTYYGAKRLGFPERSKSTNARKKRRNGNVNPNVWTGESREAALRSPTIKATATRGSASAVIRLGAPNLNFRNPKSPNKVHPAAEIKQIPDFEASVLSRVMAERVDFHLGSYRAAETIRNLRAFV